MATVEHNHPDDQRCGEKCGMYAEQMAMPMMGPTSWTELDAAHAAEEAAEVSGQFQQIVGGILGSDMTTDEKSAAIQAAAAELPARVSGEMADAMKGYKPGRIARLFGVKVTNSEGLSPDDYAVVPDPESPSTWKLRIDDASHISGAIQALSPAGFRGEPVQLAAGERATALRKIAAAIRGIPEADRGNLTERLAALKAIDEDTRPDIVRIYRGKDGTPERFALWSSNNFRDREGEIVSAKALHRAIARFDDGAVDVQADVYHVDGTEWGRVEIMDYVDGFLMAAGTITRPDVATGIADWGAKEMLGTSIGYRYWDSDLVDGVYSDLEINRITVLPRSRAANPWGPSEAVMVGRREMGFDPAKRSAMITLFGEDDTKRFEAEAEAESQRLIKEGRDSKEFTFDVAALPRVRYVIEDTKDDTAATEAPAVEAPAAAVASDEPPAWAKTLADQNAAILARLDQSDSAVKALHDEVAGLPPAAGVLGRSIQTEQGRAVYQRVIGEAVHAAKEDEQGQPIPESVGGYAPGSAVAKAMAQMTGRVNGDKPASH